MTNLQVKQWKCIIKIIAHICLLVWMIAGMMQLYFGTGILSNKILFDMIIFLYITQ